MSWYKRSPRVKEPSKSLPHHTSPMTEQHLKKAQSCAKTTVSEKQPKSK